MTTNWEKMNDIEFQMTVREWVQANYPEELRFVAQRPSWELIRPWYLKLSEKGWIAPSWPTEFGGMGLSTHKQLIMHEEFERHGVARGPDGGIIMLGPLLIQHGGNDVRVPLAQAQEFYFAAIKVGFPVEMIVYPRQGHSIREPKLSLSAMEHNMEWFNKWVLGIEPKSKKSDLR